MALITEGDGSGTPKEIPRSDRPQTNVRLSPLGRRLLEEMSEAYGLTITDVLELAIRTQAKEMGLWNVQQRREKLD